MTSDTDTRWMLQALHDLAGRIRARARETADQEPGGLRLADRGHPRPGQAGYARRRRMTALTDTDRAYLAAATRGDQAEVARLSALVDAEQEAAEARLAAPGALLASATWYATALGLPVFPCAPGGKRPATPHGFKDATTDPGQIRAWWRVNPSLQRRGPHGRPVRCHRRRRPRGAGRARGVRRRRRSASRADRLRPHPRGRHLLVPPTAQGSTTNLLPSVDYRGRGGYVVLPPSRTPEGTYFWYEPLTTEVAA